MNKNISHRIKTLSNLQDGWLDRLGLAPTKEGLEWFDKSFTKHFNSTLPSPFIYPTIDGNIHAEWTKNNFDISMLINLKTKNIEVFCFNFLNETQTENSFDLTVDCGWGALNQFLLEKLT